MMRAAHRMRTHSAHRLIGGLFDAVCVRARSIVHHADSVGVRGVTVHLRMCGPCVLRLADAVTDGCDRGLSSAVLCCVVKVLF